MILRGEFSQMTEKVLMLEKTDLTLGITYTSVAFTSVYIA